MEAGGAGGALLDANVAGGTGGAPDEGGTGATGGAGGIIIGTGGASGAGGTGASASCYQSEETYTVPLPPEGVPAEPGQICSAAVEPVDSNRAARVTLTLGPDLTSAKGSVDMDPSILPRVVGLPLVEVIDSTDPRLSNMQVSMMSRQGNGFVFEASWPAPFNASTDGYTRMTVRASFELRCEPETITRVVHAATDIHLCINDADQAFEWVSSGDRCVVCRIIAEMAPSPIVPDKTADDLPLARAVRLRIVELARVSNTVVLLAENDGGPDLEYEWHASAGRVEKLAPDVVAWTLEEGSPAPFIQAAVWGTAAAAVASWGFNEAA